MKPDPRKVKSANFFRTGWDRAIQARANQWDDLSEEKRKYLVDRMAHSIVNVVIAENPR